VILRVRQESREGGRGQGTVRRETNPRPQLNSFAGSSLEGRKICGQNLTAQPKRSPVRGPVVRLKKRISRIFQDLFGFRLVGWPVLARPVHRSVATRPVSV
jgi:hypothetical protein